MHADHPPVAAPLDALSPPAARPLPKSASKVAPRRPFPWLTSLLPLALIGLIETSLAAERLTPNAEGQALAAELRNQQPTEPLTTSGILRLRDPHGRWSEAIPVRMELSPGPGYWQTRYTALNTDQTLIETLIVTRTDGGATRYDHTRAARGSQPAAAAVTLKGDAASVPFAGSEFWLTDLGLEFLHWPQQRVLRHEMRKGRSCKVLESVNRTPTPPQYARVLSWIDLEHRGILRAEAYDRDQRLVKEFSIGSFKKVDGRWQLKSMEIRNEQTDARTRLEFDLAIEDR